MSGEPAFAELLSPHVDGAALARLARYAELLERWSARHNLVSWHGRDDLVRRHLLDALAGATLVAGPGGTLLDVGSGAGLPGIPLLACAPSWRGVLLEPRQKRWAFLRLVIRELGLAAEAERCRFQDYGGGPFELVTTRAVGATDELLGWTRDRLASGGRVALWTTADEERELRKVAGWRVLSSPLPSLDRGRLVQLTPCFT